MQNAVAENFIGRLRDACLNEHLFRGLKDARQIVEDWRQDDNHGRPRTSLAGLTPAESATRTNREQN